MHLNLSPKQLANIIFNEDIPDHPREIADSLLGTKARVIPLALAQELRGLMPHIHIVLHTDVAVIYSEWDWTICSQGIDARAARREESLKASAFRNEVEAYAARLGSDLNTPEWWYPKLQALFNAYGIEAVKNMARDTGAALYQDPEKFL